MKIFGAFRKSKEQKAMEQLHKMCVAGMSGELVKGFESISFQTWLEVHGIYLMMTYGQETTAMSKDARTVISAVGLI